MYVGLKMLKKGQFPVGTRDMLVTEAEKLMVDNRLWLLMVVDGNRLVGYVRKEDMKAAMPSLASSLSKHEINYLLSKLTLDKILLKNVPSVHPETEIEEAARKMYDDDLAGLAVVDKENKLVGYISRSVMLEVLVEEMGLYQGGSRIVFEVVDRPGVIHEVSGIIKAMGGSIIATATFYHNERRMVVLRVRVEDPAPIKKALVDVGYTIVGPEAFAEEWS